MTGAPTLKMLLKSFHLPAFVTNYEDLARQAVRAIISKIDQAGD